MPTKRLAARPSCRYLRNMAIIPPATIAHIVREDVVLSLASPNTNNRLLSRDKLVRPCLPLCVSTSNHPGDLLKSEDSANRRCVATALAEAMPKGLTRTTILLWEPHACRSWQLAHGTSADSVLRLHKQNCPHLCPRSKRIMARLAHGPVWACGRKRKL